MTFFTDVIYYIYMLTLVILYSYYLLYPRKARILSPCVASKIENIKLYHHELNLTDYEHIVIMVCSVYQIFKSDLLIISNQFFLRTISMWPEIMSLSSILNNQQEKTLTEKTNQRDDGDSCGDNVTINHT